MQPRYKVIASYPGCPWFIGRIIIQIRNWAWDCPEAPTSQTVAVPDKYPAVFKKLEWHEDRRVEDMPLYLKRNTTMIKVDSWHLDAENKLFFIPGEDNPRGTLIDNHIPASETEYLAYINNKQCLL